MTAPPTSPCGSRATADGEAPPRATAAGFSHCSKASMRLAPVAAASGESLSRRISQPTGSNRTASRMRGAPNFAERKERAVARRLFPRSTKSAPPRPAPRRPSGASLTRSGPSRCAPSVFTTDGGYDDHALRPHPGTAGRAAGLPFYASANAPRSRRSWPRLWPNRPRSSATSTAPWRPTSSGFDGQLIDIRAGADGCRDPALPAFWGAAGALVGSRGHCPI